MARNRDTLGWSNYTDNFSDLLQHQHGTPKRRRRCFRRKEEAISSFSQEIDKASSSDDEDGAKQHGIEQYSEELFSSPMPQISSRDCLVKSTPSGSPILWKSSRKVRNLSSPLMPISPITPGVHQNSSVNKSVFSIHVNESSHERVSLDQTTLATPLDVTEDEIEYDLSQSQHFGGNDDSTKVDECEMTLTNFESQDCEEKPRKGRLNKTGTTWIKTIQDKIDEEWHQKVEKCAQNTGELNQSVSYFDSGKKRKFEKGGLAEQLCRVLTKEKSQKSVFLQRIKSGKIEKQKIESLLLKVLSNVQEGELSVIECRDLCRANHYNLILPQEVALCLNLTLGSTVRLYPPFYKIEPSDSMPSVLLSAYYITIEENFDLLQKSQTLLDCSAHDSSFSSPQNFESLLKCLESHSSTDEGISVITTIQRIFFRKLEGDQWSILCSDAYGTFFVVEIGNFDSNSDLTLVLSHGEGQRVILKDLCLCNRVKRSQYPALFSIVDSIWCSNGAGLMHVNSSQSQCSEEPLSLLPPSFCYFLRTEENSEIIFPKIESQRICENLECGREISLFCSDLNRPSSGTSHFHDILYKPPDILSLKEVGKPDFDNRKRFSLVCYFGGTEDAASSQSQDLYCTEESSTCVVFCVLDCLPKLSVLTGRGENLLQNSFSLASSECTINSAESCRIWVKNVDFLPKDLSLGSFIVLRDVYKNFDKISVDNFTRIHIVNSVCEAEELLGQKLPATGNE